MASLFRKSLGAFLPAALVLALLAGLAAFVAMDRLYGEVVADSLGAAASALAIDLPVAELGALSAAGAAAPGGGDIGTWARGLDAASGLRITLVRRDGRVIADSRADPAAMENHAGRPEIAAALTGKAGFSRRTSATLGQELFYAARPVRSADGSLLGVLRVSVDLPTMSARVAPAREGFALSLVVLGLLAALAAAIFSRSLSAPLGRLALAARGLGLAGSRRAPGEGIDRALGELRRVAAARGPDEVRLLGEAFAAMAEELEGRARAELLATREREAILDGMTEAVIALDGRRRLRLANRSARSLFGISETSSSAFPSFLEVSRSVDLDGAAEECLSGQRRVERELALYIPGGERWFSLVVTPLPGGEGAVMVLNDLTALKRLERVRKDFVANVSHELRTPIQMVKGFAETLLEGGHAPEEEKRWLGIIERNAARMESLVGDLLALARLEQDDAGKLETAEVAVAALVAEAVEALAPESLAKGLKVVTRVPEGLVAEVNEGLVVQALVNLLDNAVKYCPEGARVGVEAGFEGEGRERRLRLSVSDTGPGIAARHLPRLFERFYRVDGGRSRELGGTGLGLAIVKHIALAHGGDVSVESWEGEGTRFTLNLPARGD